NSHAKPRVPEVDDAPHGQWRGLGSRIANKAFGFALVKRKFDLATTLPVASHKTLEIRLGMHDVVGSLNIKDGRHLNVLVTTKDGDRTAFLHGFLGTPELDVRWNDAIDLYWVFAPSRLQALGVVKTPERIDDGPDQHG